MNIVWLTPEIPYPPVGGRNGVFNRIVQLSKYNNIYLLSIAYNEKEKELSGEMQKYCKFVKYYNRSSNKVRVVLKSLIYPFSVASRTIPELRKDLWKIFNTKKIDAVIVDFPNMAFNLKKIKPKGMYCTLNQHNIEYKRMREMSSVKTIPLYKRIAYYLESFRLEMYERSVYYSDMLNSITFFSKDDMKLFKRKWKKIEFPVKVFPLGANSVLNIPTKTNSHNLLFIGRLDNVAVPNVEAALWMAQEVLPQIKRKIKDVKLILAGANPSGEIMRLQSDNVQIIPNYQKLEDVYSLADVVVLPLLSGGGVKGKLLEAAAFEKIIISTNHGCEGTDFLPDKHIMVCNGVANFAQGCIKVLLNLSCYYSMGENAKELFERKYEWSSIGNEYNNYIMNEICK